MATIRRRGNVYYLDYRVAGKRVRKRIGKIKQYAEIALKEVEVKLAKKEIGIVESKEIGVEQFFNKYIEYSVANHSPGTKKRYRGILNNFRYFLGKYPQVVRLSDLNPELFETYKSFRKSPPEELKKASDVPKNILKPAKTKTINMEIQTFRTIFYLAMKWNYLKDNPTLGVKYLKETDSKLPRFLTKEETTTLLKSAEGMIHSIIFTFLYTGMRLSELTNLEWSDIDFDQKLIYIRRKTSWQPKTGEREIPVHPKLLVLLKNSKDKNIANNNLVFCNSPGKPLRHLRRKLIQLTKKCGFPDVTKIHSLRHTFASHLVMKGVDLTTVQKLMGHRDIQTTMIYAHLSPDHLVGAVNRLDF